ncbi:MAG: dihydrofolate reductase family protein [Acetobacteraceae bacterium]|nr:dihydrofolate reductase family protein [Acetobacteraceae bacterium]
MAARITLLAACSLDGRIADGTGGVAWLEPFEASADYGLAGFQAGLSRIVMGRATYDQVLGFGEWPYGSTPATVLTGRPLGAAPPGVTAEDGPPRTLAAGWDGHVWLNGGARVFADFLAADLVDEIEMFVMPVLLGEGPRLLDAAGRRAPRLADVAPWPNGAVRLRYEMGPLP